MIKKYITFSILFCLTSFVYAQNIEHKLVNRLVNYASMNTQSEYDIDKVPSNEKQRVLANVLADELKNLGAQDVYVDEHSYVYGTIKGNVKNAPTLFLSAHLDTSPDLDLQGKNPIPVVHEYKGGDLVINEKLNVVLTQERNKFLAAAAGGKVITSDGTTLLGGDDKAGMSVVMTIAETLLTNPSIPHGDIRIIFTPDEEIGNSTKYLTKKKIGADFGLVVDSHGFGRLLVGNFNATDFNFRIIGIAGFEAYNNLPAPYRSEAIFTANFPIDKAAYNSKGMQGYIDHHYTGMVNGNPNDYIVKGRLRSFDLNEMAEYKNLVQEWAQKTAEYIINIYQDKSYDMKYITVINGQASGEYNDGDMAIIFTMKDSYFNAQNILEKYPTNYSLLEEAYKKVGVQIMPEYGRGGSDAGDITYMGIPAYNLFDGSHNEHSNDEWVSSKQMLASYNVALNYIKLMGQQDRLAMLREGNPRYTPEIPELDMKRFEKIYNKISTEYGNSFSNF